MLLLAMHAQAAFVDQTATLAPGFGGSSAAWGDYNNDGYTDVNAGGTLWRNQGGTGFTSVVGHGQGVWGDCNNDGYLDYYTWGGNGGLHVNVGGTGWTSIPMPALPKDTSGTHNNVSLGGCWGDFDGDTYVDLYIAGYEIWSPSADFPDAILGNNGGTSFSTDWTQTSVYRGRGATACDFDEDGDIDVYVSNYRLQPNLLWLNNGSGGFTEVAGAYGVQGVNQLGAYGHTIGSAWGDFNNDGHIDLFVGNFSHPDWYQDRARLLSNDGPPNYHFTERWVLDGGDWQESYASPSVADYDNDGDLDLYFTTVYGGNYSRLYRNNGGWSFSNVTGEEGLGGMPTTYQAAWADFDNDGDLDLATGGRLYVNQGNGNHWLKVRLLGDGTSMNAAAIGAQVRIDLGGGTVLVRQVEAGTGQGNANDLTLHFGLGGRTAPVDLDIFWPDGTSQIMEDVAVDQFLEIRGGIPVITNGEGAQGVFYTKALLTGELVSSSGLPTEVCIEIGSQHGFVTTCLVDVAEGPFSVYLTDLEPATLYAYHCHAANVNGSVWSEGFETFTTMGDPIVNLGVGATGITHTTAWLTGIVLFTAEEPTDVCIEIGSQYGTVETCAVRVVDGPFSVQVTDLMPATDYAYHTRVSNVNGSSWSEGYTWFTTMDSYALNNGVGATGVTHTTAWLTAELSSTFGEPTEVCFELGGVHGLSETCVVRAVDGPFSLQVTDLEPGTQYAYRCTASNAVDTMQADGFEIFDTLSSLLVSTGVGATGVTDTAAWLTGELTATLGEPTEVYIVWGSAHGVGDTTAVYTVDGPFSVYVEGLAPDSGHGYRCSASNANDSTVPTAYAWFFTAAEPPFVDQDEDGLDDNWEIHYFGSITNTAGGADEDADNDRFIDLFEYHADTDPTNPASLLALTPATAMAASNIDLTWSSEPDHFYAVKRATNLAGDWITILSNIPATPPVNTQQVPLAGSPTFYRIDLDE